MNPSPEISTLRIARQLKAAEAQADQALLEFSKLMVELIGARQAHGRAPHTGQEALIRLARAQMSLIDGSNNLFRVHNAVAEVGREMALLDEPGSTERFAIADGEQTAVA